MKNVDAVIKAIVNQQEVVMGPLALEQAKKVTGLTISNSGLISVKGSDSKRILEDLVSAYKQLFGRASVEACKDAVKEVGSDIPSEELPDILK